MGTDHSSPPELNDFWSPGFVLTDTPGQPVLVESTRNPLLSAEQYSQQASSAGIMDQIGIYRERKIAARNIVSVLDYQLSRGILECAACNCHCFDVVTERVQHRLAHFGALSLEELIYVLHQALSGYSELARYGRICYPTPEMIGIKGNGEVKVWVNHVWSDNCYRPAPNEQASMQALLNAIKIVAEPKEASRIEILSHLAKNGSFQSVLNLLRTQHFKQIIEGKFKLEARIKRKQFLPHHSLSQSTSRLDGNTRPRAVSQQLRRSPITAQQQPQLFLGQSGKPVSVQQSAQTNWPVRPRSSIVYRGDSPVAISPIAKNQIVVPARPAPVSRSTGKPVQSPPVFFHAGNLQPQDVKQKFMAEVQRKLQAHDSLQKNTNNKINFSYLGSQYGQAPSSHITRPAIGKGKVMEISNFSPIRPTETISVTFNSKVSSFPEAESYIRVDEPDNQKQKQTQSQFSAYPRPRIEPLSLKLDLQKVKLRQQHSQEYHSESRYPSHSPEPYEKSERATMEKPRQLMGREIESIEIESSGRYSSLEDTGRYSEERLQADWAPNSRKAAEEFKYYLRTVDESQVVDEPEPDVAAYEEERQWARHVYSSNDPAIPERWEEEESFNRDL